MTRVQFHTPSQGVNRREWQTFIVINLLVLRKLFECISNKISFSKGEDCWFLINSCKCRLSYLLSIKIDLFVAVKSLYSRRLHGVHLFLHACITGSFPFTNDSIWNKIIAKMFYLVLMSRCVNIVKSFRHATVKFTLAEIQNEGSSEMFFQQVFTANLAFSLNYCSSLGCWRFLGHMWSKELHSGGEFWSRMKIGSGTKNSIDSYGRDLLFCIFLKNKGFWCKIFNNLIIV